MKYLLIALVLIGGVASAQTTYFIRADSTKLEKIGGNNELILKNSTRARTGAYLKNISNGITGFFYAIDSAWMATDSTLVVRRGDGNDTLLIRGSGISTTPGIDDVLAVNPVSLRSAYLGDTLSLTDHGYGSSVRGYLESYFGSLRWSAPAAFPGKSFTLSPSGSTNRVFNFQDRNGTIALLDDLPVTLYSGNGTIPSNRVVTQGNVNLAFGSVLSTSIYTTFNYFDTATIANSGALKIRGIQMNRNIVQNQSAVNISDKSGANFGLVFRLQDTLTVLPQGSDLEYGNASEIYFKKRADYSGRSVVRSGNGGINYDAACAHLARVEFPDDGSQGNIHYIGYIAANTSYLYGYNTGDTIDNYIGYYSTGSNLMKVRRMYNFFGTGTAANADSTWGIYQIAEQYNFLSSKLLVGGGGTRGVADSTLHVIGGLKFVTGRQGAGKVLTSDANGGADWATPTGGSGATTIGTIDHYPLVANGAVISNDTLYLQTFVGTDKPGLVPPSEGGGLFLKDDGTWASAGGSFTAPGNYGNLQINRNGAFATPGSDSLDFESATGLTVKGNITSSTLTATRIPIIGASGLIADDAGFTKTASYLTVNTYDAATSNNGIKLSNTYAGTGLVNMDFYVNGAFLADFIGSNFASSAYGLEDGMTFRSRDASKGIGFSTGTLGSMNGPNLRVTAGGDVLVTNYNFGVHATTFGSSAIGVIAIGNGTPPGSSITNGVQLYAEDVAASSELKVRDEAGNITVLSPHNFTGIPMGESEPGAWSHYSEKDGKYINVDMLLAMRTIEKLTVRVAELEKRLGMTPKHPVKLVYKGKVKKKP